MNCTHGGFATAGFDCPYCEIERLRRQVEVAKEIAEQAIESMTVLGVHDSEEKLCSTCKRAEQLTTALREMEK